MSHQKRDGKKKCVRRQTNFVGPTTLFLHRHGNRAYDPGMRTKPPSAIHRLSTHHGGPAALHRLLAPSIRPPYQRIQEWIARGWASPMHLPVLEAVLPAHITRQELYDDRRKAKRATR